MTRYLLTAFLLCVSTPAWADVFISEFLANNSTGLQDEDGQRSDWIEIHNNGLTSVNLENWALTDDSGELEKWVFPSVSIAPNSFIVVFASNKDRKNPPAPLHTNFKLSSTGGYLALVKPDNSLASEFNPYPAQYPDKPYGYAQTVNNTTFIATNASLKYLVPGNNTLGTTWTARTFDATSWSNGTNAAGFESTVPGWQFRTVFANTGNVGSLSIAEAILATPSQQASSNVVTHPVINFNNSDAAGHYTTENAPAVLGSPADYFVVEGTGIITIPTSGTWTFSVGSDDGCLLQIRPIGGSYATVLSFAGLRGMSDSIGTYNFASAGDYEIRAIVFENEGGGGGEVSARAGNHGSWNSGFRLIGDTGNGGLAIRSVPAGGSGSGGYSAMVGTNLLASMYNAAPAKSTVFLRYSFNVATPANVTTLTMPIQYDDGFVAYLNGQEIGRRNVPGGGLNYDATALQDRPNPEVLTGETLDVTPFKNQLVAGTNVIAIHGVNQAANNGDFFIRPQLVQASSTTGALSYFNTATPGGYNTAAVYNRVAPVVISLDHGFYTSSQSVQLTCATAGATIYYTYDGSLPGAANPASGSGASPINLTVNGTRVLRALATKAGSDTSDNVTRTYLFLSDVITQSSTGAAPVFTNPPGATQATTAWPTGPVNGQILDYGMDPDIVQNPAYSGTIVNDLRSIPTLSVVTSRDNLFSQAFGIYTNPGQDGNNSDPSNPEPGLGQNWERRASIELINPDGTPGFQANCGLRLRGGFSRSTDNPKHAFRIFFRDVYGQGKLDYDLHQNAPGGESGAKSFDKFDLRTSQNYSWSFQGDGNNIHIRDEIARDMQLAMGQPSSRGSMYHLYLNGQYWGIFNIDERPDANFGESYFGGDSSDYDTIKIDPDNGYNLEATDGNTAAWTAFWTLADQTLPAAGTVAGKNGVYQQMKGNNPNGTPNPAFPVYLDDVGLIDQMLIVYWGGNLDAPISNFLSNTSGNNVFSVRNRNGVSGGWKGILHDSEHTMLNVNENRTGPWPAGNSAIQGPGTALQKSTMQYIFQQLVAHSTDFRALFTDRVYKHMANGGVLTPSGALAIFNRRTNEIDRAVVPESARWGDAKTGGNPPFNRNSHWINATNNVRNNFIPGRTAVVLSQYRSQGWYPTFDPPTWSLRGGTVAVGTNISLTLPLNAPGGSSIYYTLDGTDPRAPGGGIGATAIQYSGAIPITVSRLIRTRVKSAADWSALDEATFYTTQDFSGLAITEVNYAPPPSSPGAGDGNDYEFLEFKNTGTGTIDMGGVNFTAGITFTFPPGTSIAPGAFFLVIRNQTKFAARYPGVLQAGKFGVVESGNLNNAGESLTLATFAANTLFTLTYNNAPPWPVTADGNGFTAVPRGTVYNSDDGHDWRASANLYGSPGADDPAASFPPIVINEILTNPGLGADAVELHNPTAAPVNVGDWWLTDDPNTPQKYRIPAGTTIPAGGYISFTETQFNPGGAGFAFNAGGDDAFIFSGNAAGNITGYAHGFEFDGAELGRSFGRYINSVGEEQFPRQTGGSFGNTNPGPLVGPLVISEIMYNPYPGYDEYIEIRNITAASIPLYDPANPANIWRVAGVNFTFPANQSIPAGGAALVVNIAPATFRTKYSIPASVAIYGPYAGTLQDSGERLSLTKPETPILDGQGQTVVPYAVIDSVRYNDKAPWPNVADGTGPSLQRTNTAAYGDDPNNWFADGVTPGATNSTNTLPVVTLTTPGDGAVFNLPANINFTCTATDADGTVLKVEYFIDDIKVGESTNAPNYSVTWAATYGIHTLTAKALDNSLGTATSASRTIYVSQAAVQGLKGEYFPNDSLTGSPAGIRMEGPISYNNGANWPASLGFPSVLNNNFSVRWTGQIRTIAQGTHIFQTSSEQGVRLYVNNSLIINNWTQHSSAVNNGFLSLNADTLYDVTLEFYDRTSASGAIELRYTSPGSGQTVVIPASVLYPDGPPIIATQPVSLTREQGTSATFSVLSAGKNLTYQWRKNGAAIPGAVSSSLTLAYPLVSDSGNYNVLITNSSGFAISTTVTLTVTFTDSDGDGIQNIWENQNGLNSASGADALLDNDGDGFSNLAEFLASTDPRDPNNRPLLTVTPAVPGPGFNLSFTRKAGRPYSIQKRDSLTSGDWVTIQSYPPSQTDVPTVYLDPTAVQTRYYRIGTP